MFLKVITTIKNATYNNYIQFNMAKPVEQGMFDPKLFTPNQLQILAYADPLLDPPATALRQNVIKLQASTGYEATLTVGNSLPFDVAIMRINEKISELGFDNVDEAMIYNLLCRTLDDPLPSTVNARSIMFVFNNIHKTKTLKLDTEQLKEKWGKEFDKEIQKTKDARKNDEEKLLVRGSGHALALQQTRLFGGVSYRFTEKDMLKILHKCAGGKKTIDKEGFVKAVEIAVTKIIALEERINSPVFSPIIFRRPLFGKGDIRELKL